MLRYYHLYADGKTVKELSKDEFLKLSRQNLSTQKKKLLVRAYQTELYIQRGKYSFWLSIEQLIKVLTRHKLPTCHDVGCELADKTTGTCKDESCIAHPTNLREK